MAQICIGAHTHASQPDLTQCELAKKLAISMGWLNYGLKVLMEKVLVKMKNFARSKNKFGRVYVLTLTSMVANADISYLFLWREIDEYEALKA